MNNCYIHFNCLHYGDSQINTFMLLHLNLNVNVVATAKSVLCVEWFSKSCIKFINRSSVFSQYSCLTLPWPQSTLSSYISECCIFVTAVELFCSS